MKYLSVCSGIEAATVAWHPLGWEPVAFSEIDAFPAAVLEHHYPGVPNLGDMTKFKEWPDAAIDVLVGGTPCQSFSVAGLRKGLADPRGNLALVYLAIADRYRPKWLVWENVPGVLSSNGGRDFGAFVGALAELGYGWAYRVLDAQYYSLAQRRERVFVVGCLGGWARAAAVLFESESLLGDPAPSRETRKAVAGSLTARAGRNGGQANDDVDAGRLIVMASGQAGAEICRDHAPTLTTLHEAPILAHALSGEGFDASEDGTGRGTPIVAAPHVDIMPTMMNGANTPAGHNARSGHTRDAYNVAVAFHNRQDPDVSGEITHPLGAKDNGMAVGVALRGRDGGMSAEVGDDCAFALRASQGGGDKPHVMHGMAVRRLTPRECERLQGFPDDYTLVPYRGKPAADGPRYKALGNSMAVPVMRWIGRRIGAVDTL